MEDNRPKRDDPAVTSPITATAPKTDSTHSTDQGKAKVQEVSLAAGDVLTQARDAAGEVIDKAKTAASEIIERATAVAGPAVASFGAEVAERAPDIARRVRDQAAATAEDLYQQGGEYLSRNVRSDPLLTLLIAGAVGYGLGYLFNRR